MNPVSRRITRLKALALLSTLLSVASCSTTPPGTIQGTLIGIGSKSGQGAVSAWGLAWRDTVKGTSVSYSPDGSAAGIKAFRDGQAHFAVGSAPLPEDEASTVRGMCTSDGALSLAAGVLPVGVATNIEGVNEVVLDAPVLAAILRGEVKRWNDPLLVALNPQTTMPDMAITVLVEKGPSDTARSVNDYLGQEDGTNWKMDAADAWPSDVVGQKASPPLALANELDETDGGLSVLDGSIIGNRFVAAQLVFGGKTRTLGASSVVDAVSTGRVEATERAVTQSLDGQSGYALATVIYLHICREYSEEALSRLAGSFGESVLGDEAQKNANAFAFVMSPSKKAVTEGMALISAMGGGQ